NKRALRHDPGRLFVASRKPSHAGISRRPSLDSRGERPSHMRFSTWGFSAWGSARKPTELNAVAPFVVGTVTSIRGQRIVITAITIIISITSSKTKVHPARAGCTVVMDRRSDRSLTLISRRQPYRRRRRSRSAAGHWDHPGAGRA